MPHAAGHAREALPFRRHHAVDVGVFQADSSWYKARGSMGSKGIGQALGPAIVAEVEVH